jgi:hypothetical protein
MNATQISDDTFEILGTWRPVDRAELDRRALARFVAGESSESDRGTLVYLGWIDSKGFGRWVLTAAGSAALEGVR